jgi:hypothetical protein
MKRLLVILIAVIGLGISANAQTCSVVMGVNYDITSTHVLNTNTYKGSIKFTNTNNYKVNVTAKWTFIWADGKKETGERTFTLEASSKSSQTDESSFTSDEKYPNFKPNQSSCTLTVNKCD